MKDRGAAGRSAEEKKQGIAKILSELERRDLSIEDGAGLVGKSLETVRRWVKELRLAGKIEVDNGTVRLPRQAAQEPAQETTGQAIFPALDKVISLLPTKGHKSFLRLLLGVMVARYHLAASLKDGWPAAVTFGPTGAFKTALGVMVARIFGLKDESITRVIGRETSRSLLGRRVAAGRGSMTFKPSDYLAGPTLVLDEADKTGEELRRDLLLLLQGDSVLELEGVRFTAKSTPLLTFNADHVPAWLNPAYLRRSFTLDTIKDFDRRAVAKAALAVFGNIPRVNLGALRPPIKSIPDDMVAELDEHVARFLTPGGTAVWDARYISKAALGYVSLGRMPLRRSLLLVGRDYLVTAATMGQTKGDFAGYFDALLRGLPAESLPAVVEPDEPEEPEGYSLDDLCKFWVEGAQSGMVAGMTTGEEQYWAAATSDDTEFPIRRIGRGRTDFAPRNDYVLSQVAHVLELPASLGRNRRFDEVFVKKVFVAGKNEGWHTGREIAWNRLIECSETLGDGNPCSNTWWKHCNTCKQRQKYLDWQNRRLSSGKKVVQMQKHGDTWER